MSKTSIIMSAVRGTGNERFSSICVLVSSGCMGSTRLVHQCCMKVAHTGGELFVRAGNSYFGRLDTSQCLVSRQRCGVPRRVVLRLSRGSICLKFFGRQGRRILTLEKKSSLVCGSFFLCDSSASGPVTGLSSEVRNALSR